MKIGVYTIENLVNSNLYIGLSTDIDDRWRTHISELRGNYHGNFYLQNAWNKYGEENFLFEVPEECPEEYLYCQEHYWATMLNVHDERYGYNIRPTHPYGNPRVSEESKKKIAKSLKGYKLSKNSIIKREKTRRENAEKRGYWFSEESNRKRSETHKGKIVTEETRIKIRIAKKGNNHLKGRKRTKQEIESMKASSWNKKPVVSYNIDGSVYKSYRSKTDAIKDFNYNSLAQIGRAISSNKLWKDKYWKYEN